MRTITPTPEEMEKRVCRFNKLVPVKKQFEAKGIPAAAYEAVAADQTFVMMAPKGHLSATGEEPPIVGGDGGDVVTYNIVTCPPGNGPLLHAHQFTHETFMALDGRFRIEWGDKGEHSLILEKFDMVAVPPRVVRRFVNISDHDAHLFVPIQGPSHAFRDVENRPDDRGMIEQRFGKSIVERLEEAGLRFNAGQPDDDRFLPKAPRKAAAKKAAAPKKVVARKTAAKTKPASKKAARKAAPRKAAVAKKKPVARKAAPKNAAARRAPTRKTAARRKAR
ncbi:MAG: cupin domain-containing protein [Alphaproteobacteria bacterium]|nr:cupin domain-containing protein [Alphaproteobacteria bacterium]